MADSIGQHGSDGVLDVDFPFEPFVPNGRSYWEVGTNQKPGAKATKDYTDLTESTPAEVRSNSTFVFVTPLSGISNWEHTWKKGAQATWLKKQKAKGDWADIRIIDGTKLVDWMHQFPAVEKWFCEKIGLAGGSLETVEDRWSLLRRIGEPPPLTSDVFLANRESACTKLAQVFNNEIQQLELNTRFPNQIVDFVSAFIESLEIEKKVDITGRCLVVSNATDWNALASVRERHFLIAEPQLDLSQDSGTILLERARRAGHAVVLPASPGGIPHPNAAAINSPSTHQVQAALEKTGYPAERARVLAQRSGGDLGVLLRCLQNLSLMPEWAEGSAATDLAIAALFGAWNEKTSGDEEIVSAVSGKSYGEWIKSAREVAVRPAAPLVQHEGAWHFQARYEGWNALGKRLFDEHLKLFENAAKTVLSERNPALELPKDQRFAAAIKGKRFKYSAELRRGVCETLALLGSHPQFLTHCSIGRAEATAALTVRFLLNNADGPAWASLDRLLPLLAEASPTEFLDAVEAALDQESQPFNFVFSQEGTGFTEGTYLSGLLWALETLAWSPTYLNRVIICLGELAGVDPGGKWQNRPGNSLATILLPWLPQTCATIDQRVSAVKLLLKERSQEGWALLLKLLPRAHTVSSGSRRPAWREFIPSDWSDGVSQRDYLAQILAYTQLATQRAIESTDRLVDLVERLEDLPPNSRREIYDILQSPSTTEQPEADRRKIWSATVHLTTRHRKYSDTNWALTADEVAEIEKIAESLAASSEVFQYQRLFAQNEHDLYEERGNYQEQRDKLERRRLKALKAILETGLGAILHFSKTVESAWRVGFSFSVLASESDEKNILPALLLAQDPKLHEFCGGYVTGKFFHAKWSWVDAIDPSSWLRDQIAQFFVYLPFAPDTWNRVTHTLGADESGYWKKTPANPYDTEVGLSEAVDKLLCHERPVAAVRCLYKMIHDGTTFDSNLAIRTLRAVVSAPEPKAATDAYEITDVIKALQSTKTANEDDVALIEWAYLPLLGRGESGGPKTLGKKLATDPTFFCEVLRLIYRSKNDDSAKHVEPTEEEKNRASNAWHLLHDWKQIPGTREDGSIDRKGLNDWVSAVRRECEVSGHLEVAMILIGQVLVHAPADPNNLWIDHSVAELLNSKDADKMRQGYSTGSFNSRGVHGFSGGADEIKLAEDYEERASALDKEGYQRLANTLLKLAKSYRHDAERAARREISD